MRVLYPCRSARCSRKNINKKERLDKYGFFSARGTSAPQKTYRK